MAKEKKELMSEDSAKRVEETLNTLQEALTKEFGADSTIRLSSADVLSRVSHSVSSGSMVVDKVIAGGRPLPCSLIPFGRQVEVSGKPGTGKSTLCAQIAAKTQEAGGIVIVTDTEERIDHDYWRALGVDTDRVLNLRATTIEEVFDKQEKAIKLLSEKAPNQMMLMIWDSVGGTSSGKVLDGKGSFMERAEKMYGREAKVIGTGVKGLNGLIAKSKVCYLYTNHLYTRMDVTYGDKHATYGGTKLQHYASLRLRLDKIADIKEEDAMGNKVIIGHRLRVRADKNSMAPMRLEKEAVVMGGLGFCDDYTVFEAGKKLGIISNKGAWSTATIGGEDIKFQGWNGFQEKVVMHEKYPELWQEVYEAL